MSDENEATFSETVSQLPADEVARARAVDSTVVVLPQSRTDDGIGVYSENTVFLVKDSKADGVQAAFSDESATRTFEVKHGMLLESMLNLSLSIGGGVGTNAAWLAITAMLRRARDEAAEKKQAAADRRVRLVVTDLADTAASRQYEFESAPGSVAELIDRLRGDGTLGSSSDQDEPLTTSRSDRHRATGRV